MAVTGLEPPAQGARRQARLRRGSFRHGSRDWSRSSVRVPLAAVVDTDIQRSTGRLHVL